VTTSTEVHFKDFSKKHTPVFFRIDAVDFEALPTLPIPVMQKLIGQANALKDKEVTEAVVGEVLDIFNTVLKADSAQRFATRINDTENPVDLPQIMDILTWLMEMYGRRPTQPSSDSSAGLPTESDGTTSTDGASAAG
jgi:hypothetical protein